MNHLIGIFSLIVGSAILIIGLTRLTFSRSVESNKMSAMLIGSGVIIFIIAMFLFDSVISDDFAISTISIIFILVGILLISLGSWHLFYSPFPFMNNKSGLTLILLGIAFFIIGIFIKTDPSFASSQVEMISLPFSSQIYIGTIPFSIFGLIVLVFTNGLALRNQLEFGRIIGANMIMLSLLALTYVLLNQNVLLPFL